MHELLTSDASSEDFFEAHNLPVKLLRSYQRSDGGSLLSSSRHDVKLWDCQHLSRGALLTWEGVSGGRFSQAGMNFEFKI